MDAAEKTALAEQRAARIAQLRPAPASQADAYVQQLAAAVADELELRQRVDAMQSNEQRQIDRAAAEAQLDAELAQLAIKQPLLARFVKAEPYFRKQGESILSRISPSQWEDYRTERMLEWAMANGMLPAGTAMLPDYEGQLLALANWQPKPLVEWRKSRW